MDESNVVEVVLDPDATSEGDVAVQRAALEASGERPQATKERAPDDRLPTTRLPPITPPPLRVPSVPPPPPPSPTTPVLSSRETPTVPPQSGRPTTEGAGRYAMDAVQSPKPSWFRALLTTTSPPPAPVDGRRTVVLGCVLAACAFAAIALIFAFRSPPYLEAMPPVVAAMVLLTHAMLAIGAGALTYGLLRMAERISSSSAGSGASIPPEGSAD
jgi:hypothetical protein